MTKIFARFFFGEVNMTRLGNEGTEVLLRLPYADSVSKELLSAKAIDPSVK